MISTTISRASAALLVSANATFYFIAAMVLLKLLATRDFSGALWIIAAPLTLFAGVYAWLMFRGPLARDIEFYRRSQQQST